MTVLSSINRNDYVGDGVSTVFAYGFKILKKEDLCIYKQDTSGTLTKLKESVDYTLSNIGQDSGSVILNSPLELNYNLSILRDIKLRQETGIRNKGEFFPDVIESELDHLTRMDQQQQDEINRSLKLKKTDTGPSLFIPAKESRADKYFAFDGSGSVVANTGVSTSNLSATSYSQSVLDDDSSVAARSTLGFSGSNQFIVAGDIKADAVTSNKLKSSASIDSDRAVGTNHFKDSSVNSDKIPAGEIGPTETSYVDVVFVQPLDYFSVGSFTRNFNQIYPQFQWGSPSKITNPGTLPTGNATGASWSPNGEFLCVSHATSPFLTIYQRSGLSFTKLANPGTLPTGNATKAKWSSNGELLVISHEVSPFITIYLRAGSVFTKITNPVTLPTGIAYDASFSLNGQFLAVAHDTTPFISIYQRSASTTFSKLTNPASLPPANARSVCFSPDGVYLAVGCSASPYILIYKRSGTTFTALTAPATLPGGVVRGLSFSPDGAFLSVACDGATPLLVYQRSADTFTALSSPATLPTGNGYSCNWSLNGETLVVAHSSSPFVSTYKRSGATFTKQSDPGVLPAGAGTNAEFNNTSEFMCVSHTTSPFVTVYQTTVDMPNQAFVRLKKIPNSGV